MTTVTASKRVSYLRKKNRILLDKLASHSSKIETELLTLRGSIRGRRLQKKYSPRFENHCKAWARRNNSFQVSQALNDSDQETIEKTVVTSNIDEKRDTSCKYLIKQAENIPSEKNSQLKQEILSLIDYSPKSKFLRKIKSRYLCRPCLGERRKKINQAINIPVSPQTSTLMSCEEELESTVDDTRTRNQCDGSERDSSFERLKKFRDSNWHDCHKDYLEFCDDEKSETKDKAVTPLISSDQQKRNERYKINDRLFAVPSDSVDENLINCSPCQEESTQKSHGVIPKQLIVAVPGSLLEACDSVASRDNRKFKSRENEFVSNALARKLFRKPKPLNSMALRYQKGIS